MDSTDAPSDVAVGRQNSRHTKSVVSLLTEGVQVQDDFTNSATTLFGRDDQATCIREAYERVSRGSSEVLLVHGESGTGKSSLVESTRDLVTKDDGGYFVTGKFDQLRTRKEPFSAIAAALSDVCDLLLQSKQLDDQREAIVAALGPSGSKTLSRVVANITQVTEEEVDEGDGPPSMHSENFARFKIVCQKFLQSVATEEHPLFIFLDDLQWADEMSMKLMRALVSDTKSRHILLCFAYRSNDVDGREVLNLTNSDAERLPYSEITVENLAEEDLSSLLTQLLETDRTCVEPLTALLMKRTLGNPIMVMQLLQLLKTKELLKYSEATYSWTWNIHTIESEISDNPTDIIAQKIERVDDQILETLQLAAYIGHTFNVDVLSFVVNQEAAERGPRSDGIDETGIRQALKTAQDLGIVVQAGSDAFQFCHDSSQHYLHSLLEDTAERVHLRIARGLLKMMSSKSPAKSENLVFLAASNMTSGAKHIQDDDERLESMQLCLDAATLAASKASVEDAKEYLSCAIELQKPELYSVNYRLCIDLQNTYAEVLSCNGDFEDCDRAIAVALSNSNSAEDTLRAQCTKMRSLATSKRYEEMKDFAFRVILNGLGVRMPTNPSRVHVVAEIFRTKMMLRKMAPADFLSLPSMVDERTMAATKVLSIMGPVAFHFNQPTVAFCCSLRTIRLSVKHGVSPTTATALSSYAMLNMGMGKTDDAYQLGKIAEELAFRSSESRVKAVCLAVLSVFVYPWRETLMTLSERMYESYKLGMKSSADMSVAYYGLEGCLEAKHVLGAHIPDLEQETRDHCRQMRELKARRFLNHRLVSWQYLLNLMGQSDDPVVLTGEGMNEKEFMETCERENDSFGANLLHFTRLALQTSFEDWDLAEETLPIVIKNIPILYTSFQHLFVVANVAMVSLALFERKGERRHRVCARRFMKTMKKWYTTNVPDAEPLYLLIKAEWMSIMEKDKTSDAFDEAIEALKRNSLVVYETMAYQRVIHMMWRHMDIRKAREYLTTLTAKNEQWGNLAKVEWLKRTFSEVIRNKRPAFEVRIND